MLNVVVITGRLTAAPELKYTQSNTPVCSFTIAVDRKGKAEEKQTDFINIVAWNKTAEFVSKYFNKGTMIGVEGSIQVRNYTDRDGNKRNAFEVIANNVHFIESKKANVDIQKEPTNDFAEISDLDLPFN